MKDQDIPTLTKKPVACFDLDGTVRRPASGEDFPKHPLDFELFPGIKDRLLALKEYFIIAAASNQGGVAHGFRTHKEIVESMSYTSELFELAKDADDIFDIMQWAYNDPKGSVYPYNVRSLLRKPDIGMLVLIEWQAFDRAGILIDWDKSFFVGDQPEDNECADRAGIRFIHAEDFRSMDMQPLIKEQLGEVN